MTPRSVRLTVSLAAALAVATLPLLAEDHPNQTRGFKADQVYQGMGDLDHVNLFNGNLTITIPVGQTYRVGGRLEYGLTLVWTGNVWDVRDRLDPVQGEVTRFIPSERFNAGLGWRLSLGQLLLPFQPGNPNPGHAWVGPDGAEHVFHEKLHPSDDPQNTEPAGFFYTRDGTYLRLKSSGANPTIEFPDGTVHTFLPGGMLKRIADRFGNGLDVTYHANGDWWRLTDSQGRVHQVNFRTTTSSFYPKVVANVDLAAFGGARAIYTFTSPEVQVDRPCGGTDLQNQGPVLVPMLTAVTLPDASTYAMPSYHLSNSSSCANDTGHVRALDLPTKARLEWVYTKVRFPTSSSPGDRPQFQFSTGVAQRTVRGANLAVIGSWLYTHALLPTPSNETPGPGFNPAREKRTTVQTPLGDTTAHYFSAYHEPGPFGTWDPDDYGLPFTREAPGDGAGRFLSAQISDCGPGGASCQLRRTSYVRYETDAPDAGENGNRREVSTRTVYHDDGGRLADLNRSSFDGLGHYRTVQTDGTFAAGNVRTTHTDYNPARGTYPGSFSMWPSADPWILDTFTAQWAAEGAQTAKRTFKVDPQTGWVERTRIHRLHSGGESAADVLVETLHDGTGNLASERSYGGDNQALATVPIGDVVLPQPPEYRVDHTTLYGTQATSTPFNTQAGTAFSFETLDCGDDPTVPGDNPGIDLSTGLPSKCRDTSRIATSFEYDDLGRLLWVKPQAGHEGWTELVYTPATSASSLATVNINRQPNGGGALLTEQVVKFDALGRVWQEQQRMPSGSFSTRETLYNEIGWKASVSELGSLTRKTVFSGYDPFGRPGTITPPDGAAHAVTFAYAGVGSVARTVQVGTSLSGGSVAEVPATTTELSDRQGRLYQVLEPAEANGANTTTTYAYDVGNRLKQVTQATSVGTQNRYFTYDQRGFLLSEQHPEKGTNGNGTVTFLNYDARGHAARRLDGPFDLRFTYDRAERLTHVNEPAPGGGVRALKLFTYGTSNAAGVRTNGRLEQATRWNYPTGFETAQVVETYTYGGVQGRVSRRDTQFVYGGVTKESWAQSWVHDALGNLSQQTYPDCTAPSLCGGAASRTVSSTRQRGLLTAVPGFATAITYHANGLYNQITHANGVVDTQTNDPFGMTRPRELAAQRQGADLWRSGAYLYDGAGNVTKTGMGYFLHDRVSRLLDGHVMDGPTGGGRQRYQTYSFDPFGNLKAIGGDPWAPGRSTPTSPASNHLTGGTYDGAGSLTVWQGNSYTYDAFGMMTRLVTSGEDRRFIYTAGDERLWSFLLGGSSSTWALRDLDGRVLREYEPHVNWATAKDYVYRDGQLLASSHPSEGVRHLHLDHLGTPRLLTGSAGHAGGIWTGGAANCKAAPGDYDGDGDLDLSLKCGPVWNFYRDDGTHLKGIWTGGSDSDVPVPADYDGDGDADPVAYNGGAWLFYDYLTGAAHGVWTGATGNCLPAPADYDGDGNADLSLKCGPVWHFYRDNGTYLKGFWTGGSDSDVPVPADYDGDGDEEPVAFNGGAWLFYDYATGAAHGIWTGVSGTPRPAPFDYDGDGTTDLTVYANGAWHLFHDDGSYQQGMWVGFTTGVALVPGNYRGDPLAEEPALFTGGAWHFFSFAGTPFSYHAYFPFGEELTPPFQDTEQMKLTGHERDLNNPGSVADDLDYMHARFCSPLTGRFLSVDPVLNIKRAMKRPQNWNRYAYALGNPMKYVDPAGEDISLRISFATSITENERTRIIAQVRAWYERQKVGKVYVFDAARGQHGGNFFSRLFNKAYADIKVSGEASRQHTPGTVYAGSFRHLPADQFARAVSNSILHETAAHQFAVTPVNWGDISMFDRGSGYRFNDAVTSRYGTVADSGAYADPETRGKVTGGPIPVHPEDAARMELELGPIQVEPPDYE
ncbi:MAG TPA: RHS repeat-associated core domain-containing protein [Thermoanaerobaculia bacterium]|nr:RHS repeat-associated core domain-containing protein [Thermoanaerobaculia bacterium]